MSIANVNKGKQCKVSGCTGLGKLNKYGNRVLQRSMCNKHYARFLRGSDIEGASPRDARPATIEGDVAKIPLGVNSKYGYALVDKSFSHLADKHKWTPDSHGYPATSLPGRKRMMLHHAVVGKPPKGLVTDHINRDKFDNRVENLRFTTQLENLGNISTPITNTSGHMNICWNRAKNKWKLTIIRRRKVLFSGHFLKIDEAIAKREEILSSYTAGASRS